MTYNHNDENRPPNYCGVEFGHNCCPECGGEAYMECEGSGEFQYYDYDVPKCKHRTPKNRWT